MNFARAAPIDLPFAGGKFRLSMGMRPIEERAWFDIGENLPAELSTKSALLANRHEEVFRVLPAAWAPALELLGLLARHLSRHHPAMFRVAGNRLINQAMAESWDVADPSLHPLDIAGRLVPEDVCLLQSDGERPILVGASLCSPARWLLSEKIGEPVSIIHNPVPGYHEALGQPVDRFLARLKPETLLGRFNWGIVDDPAPFQPVAPAADAPIAPADIGEKLWLRVERQTLRRLPETGAIVFTIRTAITRLDSAVQASAVAQDLAIAIRSMPVAMQRYKRIAPHAAALLAWLDARTKT